MKSQFRFTTPFNVNIEKKGDDEEVHLDGFISTTDQDLVNDVVTKKCLESMASQIIDKNLKLDVEHESFRGETNEEREINKSKIPAGRIYDAAVEQIGAGRFGLRVKAVLNSFRNDFNNIKGSIMNKFIDAYSIAFLPTKASQKEIDGKNVRFLDDLVLLNVALTGNPINTTAQNRKVFMKAINSIEDYNEEKKSNPEIERQLNVKSIKYCPHCGYELKMTRQQARNEALNEEEDEDEEDEDEKKKKKKEKKGGPGSGPRPGQRREGYQRGKYGGTDPSDYPKDVWNRAQDAPTREEGDEILREYDKKKRKETKHNHKSDIKLNQGGKNMDQKDENREENAQEPQESQEENVSEESKPESQEESTEAEEKDEEPEKPEEEEKLKSLKKEVEELKSTVKVLESKLKAPVHKAKAEQRPKEQPVKKSVGPLDQL